MVMGIANGAYYEAVMNVMKKVLNEAGNVMFRKDASKCSRFKCKGGFLVDL